MEKIAALTATANLLSVAGGEDYAARYMTAEERERLDRLPRPYPTPTLRDLTPTINTDGYRQALAAAAASGRLGVLKALIELPEFARLDSIGQALSDAQSDYQLPENTVQSE